MILKNFRLTLLALIITLSVAACDSKQREKENFINENIEFAVAQTELMLAALGEPNGRNYPRRIREDGTVGTTGMTDWTPGFFPGSLWYLYELTGDAKWREEARKWTNTLEPLKTFTGHHDLGFMMYCSYGNAIRLAPEAGDKDILIQSAGSLATRFDEKVGVIKSWNRFRPWGDTTVYHFPVIIDNMMNLEMLFYASKVTENSKYYDVSVKHSDATLKNQFREDFGTWHVVCYDPESPAVLGKFTSQGYSNNSTWARGQAWAIYGYTMTYRETRDKRYLDVATKATDFFLKHLPENLIPVWDFNVGMEGFTPGEGSHAVVFKEKLRDASAAAIVCSALFELGQLANNQSYIDTAIKMLRSLASPTYRAELGTNANFLLMHSVGALPQGYEIDTPLVYADYYFLEALVRYKNLSK
jgi:uncharacterized protein YyaL (SSP411 family)